MQEKDFARIKVCSDEVYIVYKDKEYKVKEIVKRFEDEKLSKKI